MFTSSLIWILASVPLRHSFAAMRDLADSHAGCVSTRSEVHHA